MRFREFAGRGVKFFQRPYFSASSFAEGCRGALSSLERSTLGLGLGVRVAELHGPPRPRRCGSR